MKIALLLYYYSYNKAQLVLLPKFFAFSDIECQYHTKVNGLTNEMHKDYELGANGANQHLNYLYKKYTTQTDPLCLSNR